MSDSGTWERLDAPAATPASILARRGQATTPPTAGGGRGGMGRTRRLARSDRPLLSALDGGGDSFQRHLRDLLVGTAALLGPLVAVNLWVTVVAFDRFDPDDALFPSLGTGTDSGIEDVATFIGATFMSLATAIVGFYVATVVLADRLGRPVPGLGVGLRRTLRHLPIVTVAWVFGHWWQPVLVLFAVSAEEDDVAGVVMLLGLLAWVSSAATLFTIPAMVAERLGPIAALRRAWRLFRRASGTTLMLVLLSVLLGGLYLVGVATLAPLLEANGFVDFGGAAWIVQGVLVQLGVLLVVPLVACCTTQCYVEVRLDRESLDVLVAADDAFGAAEHDPVERGAPA
ncbi:MAG: hypothetical protein AAFP84_12920 [Actinomycetota bacterium]